MTNPSFSFEFFPPKTEDGVPAFLQAVRDLAALKPAFQTLTFGSGGGSRSATAHLARRMQKETGIPTAAHITFLSLTKFELKNFTDSLWEDGITRLIALRGDFPQGWQAPDYSKGEHYRFTDEFVRGLKSQHDFDISVGAYPEKHPDAPDLKSDIEALKKKCGAGATRAITQFFFDNEVYFRFVEAAQKAGIDIPIVPGLLPIQNFAKAQSFALRCGASLPQKLGPRFEGLSEEDSHKAACEVLAEQIAGLKAVGVPHLHFYVLNKSPLCMRACRLAGLVE